jgi:RNA recognition motif-containing protein
MPNQEEAKKAIADLNGKDLKGRPLTVNEARPRPCQDRDCRFPAPALQSRWEARPRTGGAGGGGGRSGFGGGRYRSLGDKHRFLRNGACPRFDRLYSQRADAPEGESALFYFREVTQMV